MKRCYGYSVPHHQILFPDPKSYFLFPILNPISLTTMCAAPESRNKVWRKIACFIVELHACLLSCRTKLKNCVLKNFDFEVVSPFGSFRHYFRTDSTQVTRNCVIGVIYDAESDGNGIFRNSETITVLRYKVRVQAK